jgi:hypothetical protein
MFVGHYGVSFAAARRKDAPVPLWVLFIAVQLLDVAWAPLVLLGIEKVRIVPGFTATNPLDLYYMPYTHSLVAAVLWSAGAALLYRLVRGKAAGAGAIVVALAVFSHWILDFIVHKPDLPLYDNTAKVGLGLWDHRALAFGLEAAVPLRRHRLYLGRGGARRAGVKSSSPSRCLAIQADLFRPAPTATRARRSRSWPTPSSRASPPRSIAGARCPPAESSRTVRRPEKLEGRRSRARLAGSASSRARSCGVTCACGATCALQTTLFTGSVVMDDCIRVPVEACVARRGRTRGTTSLTTWPERHVPGARPPVAGRDPCLVEHGPGWNGRAGRDAVPAVYELVDRVRFVRVEKMRVHEVEGALLAGLRDARVERRIAEGLDVEGDEAGAEVGVIGPGVRPRVVDAAGITAAVACRAEARDELRPLPSRSALLARFPPR